MQFQGISEIPLKKVAASPLASPRKGFLELRDQDPTFSLQYGLCLGNRTVLGPEDVLNFEWPLQKDLHLPSALRLACVGKGVHGCDIGVDKGLSFTQVSRETCDQHTPRHGAFPARPACLPHVTIPVSFPCLNRNVESGAIIPMTLQLLQCSQDTMATS